MNVDGVLFALLAGAGLLTAIAALLAREIVHTIMWIAILFVSLGLVYFLLEAPFLGVLQLAVYAGAVTILLLFAIMVVKKRIFSKEVVTGIGVSSVALAVALATLFTLNASSVTPPNGGRVYDTTLLSVSLFASYGAWVLALGFVVLSALVGAVYLARESRGRRIRAEGE
ncbi:MAG: NADH-quinone oxidoreductase subunit J [Candidatus Thermoplasmatota archaeon]|nr:NADH-quinone oxidoreductase subunit J [Candidatus Thermoplasmatota archaeon]